MKIDLQAQYGFSAALQSLEGFGEGGVYEMATGGPGPGEGGGWTVSRLHAKIGLGEGGAIPVVGGPPDSEGVILV